jgi:hypothetical protein
MIRDCLPFGSALLLAAMAPMSAAWAQAAPTPQVTPEHFPMQSPVGAPSAPASPARAPSAPATPDRTPSPMACSSDPVDLPPELSAWNKRRPLLAARDTRSLSGAKLTIGKAIEGGLRPAAEMRYAQKPEKPGGSTSFGGLYTFAVAEKGDYRVALGSAAWVDVVRAGAKKGDGTVMKSTGHGHGPDCSGIRKMVDFKLQPGTYLVQLSGSAAARLPLLVAQLP